MRNLNSLWILLLFSTPLTSAMAATELARINNTVITLESFNKKYQENLKHFQFKAPTKKGVLDDLIKRELGIQEAKKLGLDKDPAVIDQMNTILFRALLDKKMGPQIEKINISDTEAKNYYEKNPEIRTSHIFISVPPNAKPEDEKKSLDRIKEIYSTQVRPGKLGFAEVAQRFSEGPTAAAGGDIDFKTKDVLDSNYYNAAKKLRVGGISDPVRSSFGYHIIKLTAVKSWNDADQGLVKRIIFEEKRNALFESYMNDLQKRASVKVKSELIKE